MEQKNSSESENIMSSPDRRHKSFSDEYSQEFSNSNAVYRENSINDRNSCELEKIFKYLDEKEIFMVTTSQQIDNFFNFKKIGILKNHSKSTNCSPNTSKNSMVLRRSLMKKSMNLLVMNLDLKEEEKKN